jgi:hypothetical protein
MVERLQERAISSIFYMFSCTVKQLKVHRDFVEKTLRDLRPNAASNAMFAWIEYMGFVAQQKEATALVEARCRLDVSNQNIINQLADLEHASRSEEALEAERKRHAQEIEEERVRHMKKSEEALAEESKRHAQEIEEERETHQKKSEEALEEEKKRHAQEMEEESETNERCSL